MIFLAGGTLIDFLTEVEVSAFYDGAPEYRIELQAPDWDIAESHWDLVEATIAEHISAEVGKVEISRQ